MPMFSVIIPTYNCGAFIGQAIDSVLSQTFADYEVIVLDDGSTDATRDIVARYTHDARVRYIHQDNRGLAAARNAAIRASSGAYIALLDADDLWHPRKLEIQSGYLDSNPGLALLCSNAYLFHENDLQSTQPVLRSLPGHDLTADEIFERIMTRENPVVCPTTVIARWAIESVGFYDEQLSRLGAEDRDLSLRITSRFEARCTGDLLAYYRVRHNSMQRNIDKMFQARKYVLDKFIRDNNELMESRRLTGAAMSNLYLWTAINYVINQKFGKASLSLLRAGRHDPLLMIRSIPDFFMYGVRHARRRTTHP